MSSRIDAVLLTLVLALSGSFAACATPAEGDDENNGSTPGNGGTPPPMGGSTASGGGAGSTASGGGAGSTASAGGSGTGGGRSGAGGGDAMAAGAGGATAGAGGATAGAGGAAGGAGGVGGVGGGTAGSMAVMREDLGEGDGSDVVTIGDSFMNLSLGSGTEYSLDKITPSEYRHYAVPGTQILSGAIPGQWTSAKGQGAASTVIMTGGGNDIILDFFGNLLACQGAATEADLSAACIAALDEITVGVDALMATMQTDGVKDVVYIGYGYVTNNELGGTIKRTIRVQGEKCRDDDPAKTMRCHFVDPSEQLIGMISGDGIHPTVAGYDVIAGMVWDRLVAEGARR